MAASRALFGVALLLFAGCYEHHTRRAGIDAAPSDGALEDAPADGAPVEDTAVPRVPHPCVDAPVEVAAVPPEVPGTVAVVSRGPDYAVSWSSGGSGGLAILTHDGRRIDLDVGHVEMIPDGDGYVLTRSYSDTFWRATSEGEPFGDSLVLPEIVPPHWQSLERHGERIGLVAHSRFDATPHIYVIDLGSWTFRRAELMPPAPATRWSFAADRVLLVYPGPRGQRLSSQHLGAGGTGVGFDVGFDALLPTDVRFDETTESWLLAGYVATPEGRYLAAFARVSVEGDVRELAAVPMDAEGTAASIWAPNGARATIAASPEGPGLALMPIYFGRETLAGLTVAFPGGGDEITNARMFGQPSAWSPAITWSDADAGFAVVTMERDASDRTFLALRCGIRP